jgi:hypothetical protein
MVQANFHLLRVYEKKVPEELFSHSVFDKVAEFCRIFWPEKRALKKTIWHTLVGLCVGSSLCMTGALNIKTQNQNVSARELHYKTPSASGILYSNTVPFKLVKTICHVC